MLLCTAKEAYLKQTALNHTNVQKYLLSYLFYSLSRAFSYTNNLGRGLKLMLIFIHI